MSPNNYINAALRLISIFPSAHFMPKIKVIKNQIVMHIFYEAVFLLLNQIQLACGCNSSSVAQATGVSFNATQTKCCQFSSCLKHAAELAAILPDAGNGNLIKHMI